jgi:hypothetical protein
LLKVLYIFTINLPNKFTKTATVFNDLQMLGTVITCSQNLDGGTTDPSLLEGTGAVLLMP